MIKKVFFFLSVILIFSSCASKKSFLYFNGASDGEQQNSLKYETTLQPDDVLFITVTAADPELANEYNLLFINARSTEMRTMTDSTLYSYLIDQKGEVDFPVLGKIKLGGLTRLQAEEKIKDLLKDKIINAGVSIRVLNFEITVAGEVVRPGVQLVDGDRITIFEAISRCGDLTIYGKRKNVKVIREKDGVRTIATLDLTDPNIINSPYYYLAHNDLIYVEPNKTKINSSVIGPNLTVGLSAISLIVTIIALSTR